MISEPEELDDEEVQQQFGINADEAEDDLENFMEAMEKFDIEKAKRRFINSLIQGASKKGHYMFHLVRRCNLDRIRSHNLLNLYGVLMSIADLTVLGYAGPDDSCLLAGEVVKEYKVLRRLMTLLTPQLLGRRVYSSLYWFTNSSREFMRCWVQQGLPDDPKAAEMVMGSHRYITL